MRRGSHSPSNWRGSVALLALAACACSWQSISPHAISNCPGNLRSTDEIDGDFVLRLRVRVVAVKVDFPFQLVVQKKDRELVLIGLSPLGAKLFTAVQTGLDTRVDALPGAVLPIPPLNVLRDLHRFRFPEPSAPIGEGGSGELENARCGYTIRFETLTETPLS
jgi:hypothetical protein